MVWFECPYLEQTVELSESRIRHVRMLHRNLPGVFDSTVAIVLREPDEVRRRSTYRDELLFIREFEGSEFPFVVVVVVESEPRNDQESHRYWVVTVYADEDEPAMGDVVWKHDDG